ncbi:MAG: ABC transporter ATP-binding protein [Lactobacillales bacterium]|nr:ABC transporter ATP-binding protein [Lactobacillales bacterium]
MKLIEIKNVYKVFKTGKIKNTVLNDINLSIEEGEIIIILGPSGSGKTTLLNVVSGLDKITKGKISYNGKNISKYSDMRMTKFRKKNLGFIFQTYNLLEHLNVYENVLVGSSLGKVKVDIDEIIETVGLKKHKKKYMHELSGGEQQRVSIARALAKKPAVMFCDEPTGALDEKTGKIVLESLVEANNKLKTTMIIVTHNPGIALIGDRIIKMNSGKIVEEIKNEKRTNPKDIPWG